MFDPARVAGRAAELEAAGFDGAYTFKGQSDPSITVTAAAKIADRFGGKVGRTSPIIYQPDEPLLAVLRQEIDAAV
jgi:hypothetical protein